MYISIYIYIYIYVTITLILSLLLLLYLDPSDLSLRDVGMRNDCGALVVPIAQLAKDRLSDAGSLGFESHTGRVTGKSTPRLWRVTGYGYNRQPRTHAPALLNYLITLQQLAARRTRNNKKQVHSKTLEG